MYAQSYIGCSLFLGLGTLLTPFNHASLVTFRSAAGITWSGICSVCCCRVKQEGEVDDKQEEKRRERERERERLTTNSVVAAFFGTGLLGFTCAFSFWPLPFTCVLPSSLPPRTGCAFLAPPRTKSQKASNPTSLDAFQTADVKWSRRARDMNHRQTRG